MQHLVQDMQDVINLIAKAPAGLQENALRYRGVDAIIISTSKIAEVLTREDALQRAFAAAITDIFAARLPLQWYIPLCRNGKSFTILTQLL